MKAADFGKDFLWGSATSAYQIEGAIDVDGKTDSIWDVFTRKKRKVKNNQSGRIACDHYARFATDLALLHELRIPSYRFSISWPRVLPQGVGQVNLPGIDFYNRIIDSLLEYNIRPFLTVYHWDLPQILQKQGGWANRDIIRWFSEFAALCAEKFSDRVKDFIVLNEPLIFLSTGYLAGVHAPGQRGVSRYLKAAHHAMVAQGEAARAIRSFSSDAEIGTTHALMPIYSLSEKKKDIRAAERANYLINHMFLSASFGRAYEFDKIKKLRKIEKYIKANDLDKIKYDFDFIGINHYTRVRVKSNRAIPYLGFRPVKPAKGQTLTAMNWERFAPGMLDVLRLVHSYQPKKIYITENGIALHDEVTGDAVEDSSRITYIKNYLAQVLQAKQEGIQVAGYFYWSFLDNFEWAEGYKPRFGLVYVDFKTQQRICKKSALWFSDFINQRD